MDTDTDTEGINVHMQSQPFLFDKYHLLYLCSSVVPYSPVLPFTLEKRRA